MRGEQTGRNIHLHICRPSAVGLRIAGVGRREFWEVSDRTEGGGSQIRISFTYRYHFQDAFHYSLRKSCGRPTRRHTETYTAAQCIHIRTQTHRHTSHAHTVQTHSYTHTRAPIVLAHTPCSFTWGTLNAYSSV